MRRENQLSIIITMLAGILGSVPASGLPAFPGAEGFGTETPGGRGGRVIVVTTLEDSGPGSLREAVTAEGPRTVVFRVAGEIRLKSHLRITEPFITVAGQSAPGSGITIRDAGFYIQTHDVIVRFIRSRTGPSLVEEFDTQDPLQISGEKDLYNIVVDHCSFSWSIDECAGIRGPGHDITLSWNIFSEALRQPFTKEQIGKDRSHSMGMILGGEPNRCSVHHNLLAHCNSRNPRIQGGRHAFVNNVVYDWGYLTGTFSRSPEVNFIANYYKRGPASRTIKAICEKSGEMGRVYVKGNRSYERPSDALPEWEPIVAAPAEQHRAMEPFEVAPVTICSPEEAYDAVLRGAGAILPGRDPVDRRIVRDVRLGMGEKIDRPEDVGGYAPVKAGEPPADGDLDGMPDDWEISQGFDPKDPADGRTDADGDGYTNLEEYLEYLVTEALTPRPDVFPVMPEGSGSAGAPAKVTCGRKELALQAVPGAQTMFYTQTWFNDEVPVTVTSGAPGLVPELLPRRYVHHLRGDNGTLGFDVVEPGPRVIRFGPAADSPILALFFDSFPGQPPFPVYGQFMEARDHGVQPDDGDVTAPLQAVLDQCARHPQGGVVFLHRGHYRIGTLRIPSRVTLYLERHCLLTARDLVCRDGLIVFDDVEKAALAGFGTIDGRGSPSGVARAEPTSVPLVVVRNARSIRIADAVLRDPAAAGIELRDSDDITLHDVKVVASPGEPGRRGLRIIGCRNVTVRRAFLTGENGICIDASNDSRPASGVDIRETVILAGQTGIQVQNRGDDRIEKLFWRDCDVVSARRGLVVRQTGSGRIEGLVFRDMTLDIQASEQSHPFEVVCSASDGGQPGHLRDVLFDRVYTNAQTPSVIRGPAGGTIEDIKFWGVRVRPAPERFSATDAGKQPPALFSLENVIAPQFRFLYVEWPAQERGREHRLFDLQNVTDAKAPPEEIYQAYGGPADLATDEGN